LAVVTLVGARTCVPSGKRLIQSARMRVVQDHTTIADTDEWQALFEHVSEIDKL
jgi:hypothetical protein